MTPLLSETIMNKHGIDRLEAFKAIKVVLQQVRDWDGGRRERAQKGNYI